MPCVTTHESFPHMAWFINVNGIISMVPNVKTLRFPKPRFGAKCHTSFPHEANVYCTMFHNPLHMSWFIWDNFHKSYGAMWQRDIIGNEYHNFMAPHNLISLWWHVMFWTSQLVAPIIGKLAWFDGIGNPIEWFLSNEWILNPSNNNAIVERKDEAKQSLNVITRKTNHAQHFLALFSLNNIHQHPSILKMF